MDLARIHSFLGIPNFIQSLQSVSRHSLFSFAKTFVTILLENPEAKMQASYKYPDGSEYNGEWSEQGQRQGWGQMSFPDGARYVGRFDNGLCSGCGVMIFRDGSR